MIKKDKEGKIEQIKGKLTKDYWVYIEGLLNNEVPLDGSWEIEVKPYEPSRSSAQRRLQHVWYTFIRDNQENKQHTKEYIERFCKWKFGVPILRRDNEAFDKSWHYQSMYLTYEQTIDAMEFLPVTRLFNITQNAEYLDEMQKYYAMQDIHLPTRDDLYYEAMGYRR
jgi:hypothetical protein